MSEIVNEATIKVTADASGVESGLQQVDAATSKTEAGIRRVEDAAQKTGRTLENLANLPGVRSVGEGAGAAAGQVDRATKNMADAIQRATASMSAGAKGSREYYEALANSRGVNVAALKPYLDQLDAATRKAALAAEAQKKLDDSTRFLEDLRNRADSIGKTASELMEMRAAQLGVADAARPMIEQLRAAEQQGQSSFGNLGKMAGKFANVMLTVAATITAAVAAGGLMVNDAIDDLAQLDDIAQKTGDSVEALSKIQKLAVVFGTDMGAVDGALAKLARGMSTVDEESSKTQKALGALGVSSKDASGKLRAPSDVLVDVATKLQGYNDGAGKTALINDLVGKSGADLLPFLNDLAENYGKVSGVSGAAASAAAGFQDQLGWVKLQLKEIFTVIAIDALPALKDLVGAFSDVYKHQSDLAGGAGKKWADELGLGIAQAADAAVVLGRSMGMIWNAVKGVKADIMLSAKFTPTNLAANVFKDGSLIGYVKKSLAERNQAVEEANAKIEELFNRPVGQFEDAYRARLKAREENQSSGAERETEELNYSGDSGAKEAKAATEAYQALTQSINEKIRATATEAAGLAPLAESQKLQVALDEQLVSGKLKLTPARKAEYEAKIRELAVNESIIASNKRAAQGAAEWEKIRKAHADTVTKSIADAEAEARQNEAAVETFGMTKSAIEAQTLARLEDQLAQRSSLGLTLDEIEALEKLIAAKKRSTAAMRNIEELQAQKQLWESIERTAHDTFISIFDSGKSAFDRLKDALKNGLYELLYQMTVKKWIINVSAQGSGQGGLSDVATSLSGSGGTLGSLSSLLSIGKTIYSGFSTGLASSMGGYITQFGNLIGSQGISAFGTGMGLTTSQAGAAASAYGAVGNTTVAGGLSAGASVASYVPIAGWIAAGMAMADGLYKKGWDPNNGSLGWEAWTAPIAGESLLMNKVLQGIGLSGSAANLISGASIVSKIFGRKAPEVRETGLQGTINTSGFAGENYAYIVEKGGWLRSDKWSTKTAALDKAQDAGMDATVQGMIMAVKGFGAAMGLETSVINGYSKAIKLQLTDDEAKNQEVIAKMFGEVSDELALRLIPTIASLSKGSETASATLQRIATNYAGVDAALTSIGKQFSLVGLQSVTARERLVDLFGSLDVLTQQTASYAQNFLTEAERMKPVADALAVEMGKLGLSAVVTRTQFKQVIDSLDVSTVAGAQQYAALMKLADAFAAVHPATVELTEQRAALTDAYNAESQALQATISRMTSFAASLRSLKESALLGGLSPLSPAQKYAEAKSQYEAVLAAARAGDEGAQGRYQDAYTAFLEASRVVYASSASYRQDFDFAQAATEEAAKWAEAQVDVGQLQLDSLKASVSGLIEVNKSVLSVREAILQLNAAMGKNTSPLTAVAPPVNVPIPYSSYGTANTEALVVEVKALRTEVSGLRADANRQTGDIIRGGASASRDSAETMGRIAASAITSISRFEDRIAPE